MSNNGLAILSYKQRVYTLYLSHRICFRPFFQLLPMTFILGIYYEQTRGSTRSCSNGSGLKQPYFGSTSAIPSKGKHSESLDAKIKILKMKILVLIFYLIYLGKYMTEIQINHRRSTFLLPLACLSSLQSKDYRPE